MTRCTLCGATALYRVQDTGYCRRHRAEAQQANTVDYTMKISHWAATVREYPPIGSTSSKRLYASGRRSVT